MTVADDREEFACAGRFPLAEKVICAPFEEAIDRQAITPYDFVAVMTRGHAWDGGLPAADFKGDHAPPIWEWWDRKERPPAARAAGGGRI